MTISLKPHLTNIPYLWRCTYKVIKNGIQMLDLFCLIYRLYKIDTQRRFPAALPLFKGIQASPNASLADQRESGEARLPLHLV